MKQNRLTKEEAPGLIDANKDRYTAYTGYVEALRTLLERQEMWFSGNWDRADSVDDMVKEAKVGQETDPTPMSPRRMGPKGNDTLPNS